MRRCKGRLISLVLLAVLCGCHQGDVAVSQTVKPSAVPVENMEADTEKIVYMNGRLGFSM